MHSVKNLTRLLEKTDDELIRKYGEQKTVVVMSVRNLEKSCTVFVWKAVYISRAVQKMCSRETFELEYFNKDLR